MRNKEILVDEIKSRLFKYNRDDELRDYVLEEFKKRGYADGYSLLTTYNKVEIIADDLLGVFAKILYDKTKEKELNPERYYFPEELNRINNFKITKSNSKFPIIFENVTKIGDGYVMALSLQQLKDLHERYVIDYNEEAQRSHVFSEYKNSIIEKIDLDTVSREQITQKMLEGEYKTDFISLNVLDNADFRPEFLYYNEEERNLTIFNGKIEILDGFHRYMAMVGLYDEDPNLNFEIGLKITNYNLEDAKDAVEQYDKQRKLNLEQVKSLKKNDYGNIITDSLNKDSLSMLRSKIVKSEALIRRGVGFTYFSILSDSISVLFEEELRLPIRVKPITEYLTGFFNDLCEIFLDEYSSEKKSLEFHKNTFVLYIAIAKLLYNSEGWSEHKKEKLKEILSKIEFKENGRLFSQLKLKTNNVISTRFINDVYDYVIENYSK